MTLAVLGASVFVAACIQASAGLGFALVLMPVALAVVGPVGVVVVATLLGVVLNVLVLAGERRRPRVVWAEATPILLAAIPGTLAGVLVLRTLPKPALQVALGAVLIGATALRLRRAPARRGIPVPAPPARIALGLATGALSTATGVTGPPLAIWLRRRGLSPAELRDSLSAMFLVIGVVACAALVPVLARAHLSAALLLTGTAAVVAGHALGRQVFARLSGRSFERLVQAVILAAGIASVLAGAGLS